MLFEPRLKNEIVVGIPVDSKGRLIVILRVIVPKGQQDGHIWKVEVKKVGHSLVHPFDLFILLFGLYWGVFGEVCGYVMTYNVARDYDHIQLTSKVLLQFLKHRFDEQLWGIAAKTPKIGHNYFLLFSNWVATVVRSGARIVIRLQMKVCHYGDFQIGFAAT